MTFKACIFDLDGTLLDTLADIAASVNEALFAHGYPTHDVARFRTYVGDGVEACIQRVLPKEAMTPALVSRLVTRMREIYVLRAERETAPYAGITDLLNQLKSRNMPMAVLSNKPHPMLVEAVQRFFPQIPFVGTLGVNAEVPPKPSLVGARMLLEQLGVSCGEICYVGDTDTDMKTAVSAGFYAVGVSWGFRSVTELRAHGANLIVDHPSEILDLIQPG